MSGRISTQYLCLIIEDEKWKGVGKRDGDDFHFLIV
jgi:hypothetical protein